MVLKKRYYSCWVWYLHSDNDLLNKWEKSNNLTWKLVHIIFYNDITNLKDFDARLLKVDRKSYKNIDVYYVGYITIKKNDDYESIYRVNPLYLRINHVSGYIDQKKWKCTLSF